MSEGREEASPSSTPESLTATPPHVMTEPTLKPNDNSQEGALQGLLDYCKEQSIFISSSIAAQSFPGRGLGVYTLKPIKKGEKLMHVPTHALLTTQSIPDTFISKPVRKRMTVHCALAAFLAFGSEQDLARYQPWMATWPTLDEFVATVPVLWNEDFRKTPNTAKSNAGDGGRQRKRRKTLNGDTTTTSDHPATPPFSRSPAIDDNWLTLPQSNPTTTLKKTHIETQAAKIRACITSIDKHLPTTKIRDLKSHSSYLKFLHMWSCVNTRCFYYLRPGQTAPEDSNEAMALCPFQDLFNHSDAPGCTGIFDKRGFYVTADKDYAEGEELFLQYGKHTNDMLWMEYGFTMAENKDDEVKLDRVVALAGFSDTEKELLKSAGYSGDYTLKSDGVCYRTIVTSYLGVLTQAQWKRMVAGGLDPETSIVHAMSKLKARRRIVDWIMQLRAEAEANLRVLFNMNETELLGAFVGEASLSEKQRESGEVKSGMARDRRDMCVVRWKQVFEMCMAALGTLELDCKGTFLDDEREGRTVQDLEVNVEEFIKGIQGGEHEDERKP